VWFVRDCFVFCFEVHWFWLFYPFRSSCTSVKEFVPDLRAILLCFTCRLVFFILAFVVMGTCASVAR
jgi:hypothetical protein